MTAKTSYPKWLHSYVSRLQKEMKLSHWEIKFDKEYCDEANMAEIDIAPSQHRATITLCKGWKKWNPSVLRATIAHELMHCHLNAINEIAEEHLMDLSPKNFHERKLGIDYVNERVTDALAEMVSPFLSLPGSHIQGYSRTSSHTLAYSRTRGKKRAPGKKKTRSKVSNKKTGKKTGRRKRNAV